MYKFRMFRRYPATCLHFHGRRNLTCCSKTEFRCCRITHLPMRSPLSNGSVQYSNVKYFSTCTDITKETSSPVLPEYLRRHYWWAYINPTMIQILDRQWLVDIVLWGNFSRLRDAALNALRVRSSSKGTIPSLIHGKTLQVSCVYANLTETVAESLAPDAELHVVDVVPAQLRNLQKKLLHNPAIDASDCGKITLACLDASNLSPNYADTTFDNVLIFFLLHETPDDVRHRVLYEACRVLKNGGNMVIIDYHRPTTIFWRFVMASMYYIYEPFAIDLWKRSLFDLLPPEMIETSHHETFFGGLYQKVVVTKEGKCVKK